MAYDRAPEAERWRGDSEQIAHQREELALQARHLAAIAHEMKNPLQSLENLLHLLQQGKLASEERDLANLATRELIRLKYIATQVLRSSHSNAKLEDLRLEELIAASVRSHSERISAKNIQIFQRIECEGRLRAVPIELRQVIDNLLTNAMEAVPAESGKVVVHLYEVPAWKHAKVPGYRLVIADNGCGITREHQARLFQPFFTTKADTGTGLGLWVVNRIIREHNGAIRVRSSVRG